VAFACAKESMPAALAGTVTGVVNMGSMGGGMLLQPAIGWLLDLRWKGTILEGIRIYDLDAYRWGFIPIAAFALLAVLAGLFTTETRCRQTEMRKNGAGNG